MISIIIVVYNASKYLKYAIDSVLQQTYTLYEVIAIDDGSTDDTYDILCGYKYLPNFSIIKKDHTQNLGGNRNEAIKMAKGEYIAFIDGDDIWEKDKLSTQLSFMENYSMACSNALIINENNEIVSKEYIKDFNSDIDFDLAAIIYQNYIIVSSVLIKKQAIINSGYFEDGPNTRAEDYILWLSFLEKEKIKFINKPLLRYRIHEGNWSYISYKDRVKLLNRTLELRSKYFTNYSDVISKAAKKGCNVSYAELAKLTFKNRDYTESKRYSRNLIMYYDKKISLKFLKYLFSFIYFTILCFVSNSSKK